MSASPLPVRVDPEVWDNLFEFLEPPGHDSPSLRGVDRLSDGARAEQKLPTRRERAHARYEEIFAKLTAYFDNRGCGDAEDRAVDTILRVAKKCHDVTLEDGVEPISFFYGCARRVLHEVYREWARESKLRHEQQTMPAPESTSAKEIRDQCLEDCMGARLNEDERELIIDYYRGERGTKIENRRRLAITRNKDLNAIRIETHRIRKKLRPCISDCMNKAAEGMVTP